MTAPPIRLVVTGHDPQGRAIVAADTTVNAVAPDLVPGASFHRIWGADTLPTYPDDGTMPIHRLYFPPVGGARFVVFTLPPGATPLPDHLSASERRVATEQMELSLPGLLGHMDRDDPGMHATATVDLEVVLSGTAHLELDGGLIVTLNAGDCCVQNGTRHRWSNPSASPVVIAVVMLGVIHEGLGGSVLE